MAQVLHTELALTTPRKFTPSSNKGSPYSPQTDAMSVGSSPSYGSNKALSSQAMTLLNSNSVGSLWTVQLASLKQSGSYFEAIECLRRIRVLLSEVDLSDRLKYCKQDYDDAVKILRKKKVVWNNELFKEVVAITVKYFSANPFQKLPVSTFIEILMFIPVEELVPLLTVCCEWYEIGTCNEAWSNIYRRKFLINNPGRLPSISENMMLCYHTRLMDPCIGDKVEVAWRGKFRLETSDVYQGLAWWVAEIVNTHPEHKRYKIRYPGWDSRWDEWVPRSRLRWKVSTNTIVSIQVGDVVELWCCGANVPGAWLESKVKRIRNGRYCLGRVLSSGYLWVERERIRLVRRPFATIAGNADENLRVSSRSMIGNLVGSLSLRFQSLVGGARGGVTGFEVEGEQAGEVVDVNRSCAIM
eukprot:CAMPEP_0170357452 /NCGR_PEP_ID=MMETSP0117_2-20130122/1715_1 /TAXON_ID=400756 /ORGANISM="Durinskia baltica, Strain CSIRO CS-38" /LENGTH=412 /DNA_ID=CAMNT_0010611621 /DNA_START=116 /DNA_END=1354 /DNA_ORIENTATION=+